MAATRKIGAMVVPMVTHNNRTYVLLGYNLKKQAWELPGGKIENSDLTVMGGALRELAEETSLSPAHIEHCALLDTHDTCLILGFVGHVTYISDKEITLERLQAVQPNPEAHKFREWVWFDVTGGSEAARTRAITHGLQALNERLTWASAAILCHVGVKADPSVVLACPFTSVARTNYGISPVSLGIMTTL